MTRSRTFLLRATFATMAALLPISSISAEVHTDFDHQADFSHYHTFSLYKVHASDSLVETRLRQDIEQSLTRRGFQEVAQGGDLSITAIGSVKDQQEYNTFYDGIGGGGFGYGRFGGYRGWGGWGGGGGIGGGGIGTSTTSSYTIPVGTLAVDLYDSSTHQLVFRGTSTDDLSSKASKNDSKAVKEIDKIFDKLPKQSKG